MIASRTLFTFVLGLVFMGGGSPPQDDTPGGQGQSEAKSDSRAMQEDVEILRRLLVQRLQGVAAGKAKAEPGRNTGVTSLLFSNDVNAVLPYAEQLDVFARGNRLNQPYWSFSQSTARAPGPWTLEGTYLKGQGIVYTMTLLPVAERQTTVSTSPPVKRLSEWERLRREVRGEKANPAETKTEARTPSLTEALLAVLAENGRNLAHLPPEESVTLIVTFREVPSAFAVHDTGASSPNAVWLDLTRSAAANQPAAPGVSAPQAGTSPAAPGNVASVRSALSTVRDYRLLGEVSQKKGNYDEALRAYQEALRLAPESKDSGELREVYTKMAQAHLAKGDVDAARKVLEIAAALQPRPTANPKPAGAPALPAKLILSAPKRLLDQVGAKKIGFEEFAKQVTLHHYAHQ